MKTNDALTDQLLTKLCAQPILVAFFHHKDHVGPAEMPWRHTNTGTLFGSGRARKMPVNPASYSITGFTTKLPVGRKLTASPSSYAITGSPTKLPVGRKVSAAPASFAITGSPITPPVGRKLTAGVNSMTISGFSATLVGPGAPVVTVDINVQRPYGSLWNHPY